MALTASTTGKKVETGAAKLRKLASSLKPFGKLPNLLSAQHHARSATTFDKQGGEARQQKLEPEHKLEDKDKEHQEKIHDKNSNESLGDPYPTTSTGASPSANDNNNNNNNNNKTSPPATPPTKKAAKKKKRSFFGEMEDDERRETSTAVSESTCTTHTPKRSRTESFARPQTNTTPLGGPVRSSNAGRQDAPRRAILQQSSENAGSDIKKQNTSLRARQDEKENEAATWNALRSSDEDVGKICDGKDEIEKNGDENDRNQEDDHLEDLEVMNALRRPLSRSSSAATSPSPSPFPPTPFIRTVDGHAMRVPVLDAAPEFTADPLFQAVHDQLAQLVDGVSERADFASNLAGTASELRQRAESLVRSKQAAVGQIKALIEQAGL
ncbi:Hypothetical Protein FCC1311_110262 [Hondaea fermentalgiana]|uniref:Uncharacterized protein n=1 Tax=Hondaea fermentalgiana TaxID=2315210 RepID=A0A2R5H321_9STRA|nr:Hypothetical Protein FCC1311_110262 [Hondaea fermentalgiana]|eukprot:GBG34804.1 Hypothetical Protein FCC1311_110262 [Hondaea fermentalgiana]